MPHPVFGPPSHVLETVNFTLHLPLRRNQYLTRVEASGRSSTQRSSLWSVSESWTTDEQRGGLEPTDMIHHLALIAYQDAPASQEALFRQVTGLPWVQEELPL